MKSMLAAAFLLIFGALAAPAQDVPPVPETPWYPLKVGNTWHYRVIPSDGPPTARPRPNDPARKVVIRVDKLVYFEFKKDGKEERVPAFKLVGASGDNELSEHVAILADGIYKYAGNGKNMTAPLCILKHGARPGDSWDCVVPVEGGSVKGTFKVSQETIKVKFPSGERQANALRVSGRNFTVGNRKMAVDIWFVEGIGIVKQVTTFGTLTVIQELERFIPAGSNTL